MGIEDARAHGLGVLVAELEDVADLDGFAEAQGLAADGVEFAFVDVADVGDAGLREVAAGGDVAIVEVELVGSGDEVGTAFETGVDDDDGLDAFGEHIAQDALELVECFAGFEAVERTLRHHLFDADRAEETRRTADVQLKFFGGHGAQLGGSGDGVELGLVHLVVAAEERNDGT